VLQEALDYNTVFFQDLKGYKAPCANNARAFQSTNFDLTVNLCNTKLISVST